MAWNLEFSAEAEKDLGKLDPQVKSRILKFLFSRVGGSDDPSALGVRLVGSEHSGALRFRVGDYRIIANLYHDRLVVMVVAVGHGREVYR